MESFFNILRQYPAIALFLTLGIGFFIGRIRIGNFSLGNVTSVLLVGVVVGQLDIQMPGPMKTVFFMLFLFSIGYSVGPDFFKSLKGAGAKQALFAVIMSSTSFLSILFLAKYMGYSKGETVGLFAGSQTCSSLLGVGSEAISKLGLPAAESSRQLNIIPVCYAVTYVFGTLGTVILLGNFGPKLLGGVEKVKSATRELEKKLSKSGDDNDPAVVNAMRLTAYRAYRVENPYFSEPRTVRDLEVLLRKRGLDVYVDRILHDGEINAPGHDEVISQGDEIVIAGRREFMINIGQFIGKETFNTELLDYPLYRVDIVVAKKDFIGVPLHTLRQKKYMHGVVVRNATRKGQPLDISLDTTFEKGDRITVMGRTERVGKAGARIGHVDRPSVASDIMFVGLALFIGGIFGALSIVVGGIPVSFGTSGGALLAGLFFGWLRSKRPTYGNISPGALWLLNNLGLNVFIAVVGIEAAPSFISGIREVGWMLLLVGAVATLIPLSVGLFLGHKIFKFNPAITLGCCCGTRTCTAALGAVQTALDSPIPAIGYTITYAVSNILLVIWGIIAVSLI